ncbi:MAG TPA: choice-of-anchor A family protein [Lacipirellulaceae bacterium]
MLASCQAALASIALGTAGDYSEFVIGNSTRSNTNVSGAVAAGGTAQFTSFGIGSGISSSTTNLVVGGALTDQNSNVKGSIVTGGNANYTNPSVTGNFSSNGSLTLQNGSVTGNVRYNTAFSQGGATIGGTITGGVATPIGVNFANEASFLTNLSAAQVNGGDPIPVDNFGTLTFTAVGASAHFFNATGAQLQAATGFKIDAPAGATVVINASGSNFTVANTGFTLTGGITVDHVLWNMYQATTLSLSSISGSVLAPLASVTANNGSYNGNFIAAALNGNIGSSTVDEYFNGSLRQSVPEASAWALMLVVGIAAEFTRRWRRAGINQAVKA